METITARTRKRHVRTLKRTTGNDPDRAQIINAAAKSSDLERLQEQIKMATEAGLALPPSVVSLGTTIVDAGVRAWRKKFSAWDKKPSFYAVCNQGTERIAAERREDTTVKLGDLYMRTDGRLLNLPAGQKDDAGVESWLLTSAGLQGLLGGFGVGSGSRYLIDASPDLRALNLNWHAQSALRAAAENEGKGKEWVVRHRQCMAEGQEKEREVFAAVSTGYPKFDADELTEMARTLVPEGAHGDMAYDGERYRIGASWFSDIRPQHACAGEVFRGWIFLSTRDDGRGAIQVYFGVERNLCVNLAILGRASTRISIKHSGDREALQDAVRAAISQAGQAMERFAATWTAARKENILQQLGWGSKFGSEEVFRAMIRQDLIPRIGIKEDEMVQRLVSAWQKEPGYTRADLVNAITRAAHENPWSSPWSHEELEATGGHLLEQRVRWQLVGDEAEEMMGVIV